MVRPSKPSSLSPPSRWPKKYPGGCGSRSRSWRSCSAIQRTTVPPIGTKIRPRVKEPPRGGTDGPAWLGGGIRRFMSLLVVVLAAAAWSAAPAAAQLLPPDPPLSASSNVHLLGHIPGSAAGMDFKDHYAYVSGWGGITVLDIAQADVAAASSARCRCRTSRTRTSTSAATRCSSSTTASRQDLGSVMYVVSIANPTTPTLSAVLPLGLTGSGRGSGHIANFVKADCSQAWVDGGDLVEVVDLTDPERAEVARQVRVGGVAERRASRSRTTPSSTAPARSGRSAAAARPATADRQPARAEAARHDGRGRAQPLARTTTSSSTTRSGAGRRC